MLERFFEAKSFGLLISRPKHVLGNTFFDVSKMSIMAMYHGYIYNIILYHTSVDPPQDCGGVWLDMSIVGSVMHVSSSRLSSNLYGTCGLMDLSCMFRHQVRTKLDCKVLYGRIGL